MRVEPSRAADLADWMNVRTHGSLFRGLRMLEVTHEDERIGAVAFDYWMPNTCVLLHVVVDSPGAMLFLLGHACNYIFGQLGLKSVVAFISTKETWHKRLQAVTGAKEIGRIAGGAADGADLILVEVRPETCPVWKRAQKRGMHDA